MNQTIKPTSISADDLALINSYTRRDFTPDELFTFSVILCDNEIDRDFEAFTKEALGSLGNMYLGKTGIFDHDPKGNNQTARIFWAQAETQPEKLTSYGQPYTCLKAKAYMVRSDKYNELILEIDGGIKKEVSVGCRVEKRTCSVCGADLSHGYCEHSPGEDYGGSICYTKLEQPSDAYEWSFVAVPAQVGAGVIKHWQGNDSKQAPKRSAKQLLKILGSKQIVLSRQEQLSLKKHISGLEKQADIGREYLKDLKKEVISLGFLTGLLPDEALAESIVNKMDISELSACKQAYSAKLNEVIRPQLALNEQAQQKSENNEFRI